MTKALPHNLRDKCFLPEHYEPSAIDVICARGTRSFYHGGNKSFRRSIADNVQMYGASRDKREKSMIVSSIANKFYFNEDERERCRFVRFCHTEKLWYEISYDQVRQKVGQTMRDTMLQQDSQRLSWKKQCRARRECTRRCISANTKCYLSQSVETKSACTTQPEEHSVYSQLGRGTVTAIPPASIQYRPSILPNWNPFCENTPLLIQLTSHVQYAPQNVSIPGLQPCYDLSLSNLEWATSVHDAPLKVANRTSTLSDCRLDSLDSDSLSISSSHWFQDCDEMSNGNWLDDDQGKLWK